MLQKETNLFVSNLIPKFVKYDENVLRIVLPLVTFDLFFQLVLKENNSWIYNSF